MISWNNNNGGTVIVKTELHFISLRLSISDFNIIQDVNNLTIHHFLDITTCAKIEKVYIYEV